MYINYKRVTKITLEQICTMLETDDSWLERAIVVLHDRQTELEKRVETTYVKNEIGLQQADAKLFSEFAEQIKRGVHLSEAQKREARRPWNRPRTPIATICKYRRQILDIIEAKAKQNMLSPR